MPTDDSKTIHLPTRDRLEEALTTVDVRNRWCGRVPNDTETRMLSDDVAAALYDLGYTIVRRRATA